MNTLVVMGFLKSSIKEEEHIGSSEGIEICLFFEQKIRYCDKQYL